MVQYLPSQKTKTITISELEYATALTISAPDVWEQKVPFTISGRLTFREGMVDYPLSNQPINLSYDATTIGSPVTDGNGEYSLTTTIDVVGSYTLKAVFPGATALLRASSTSILNLGLPLQPVLAAAIPIALGLALTKFVGRSW